MIIKIENEAGKELHIKITPRVELALTIALTSRLCDGKKYLELSHLEKGLKDATELIDSLRKETPVGPLEFFGIQGL